MGRRLGGSLVFVALAAVSFASMSARASLSQEQDFVARINAERSSRGISIVASKADLADVARSWSAHMASEGSISHDPNLPNEVQGWTMLGDTVGKGDSVSAVHDAFMKS